MLPTRFPSRVVILGGGTAGWMAAAYLDRTFNLPGRRRLPITLIESPAIGRIGVGEATIPTLRQFCEFLGIGEAVLMQRTRATLKHGVLFRNWNGDGEGYFHPFQALGGGAGADAAPSWLARRARGVAAKFEIEAGVQSRLALMGLSPKRVLERDYVSALPYAYHLDAEAFADLLMEVARARGVEHSEGRFVAAERNGDGDLTALVLDDGHRIEGDLFVDCSGFAQLLIGKELKTQFHSYGDSLLCDRAVAVRLPTRPGYSPPPYTQAIAQDCGWMWRIGLQDREGSGYVYSSHFIDDDDAEAALRAAVGAPDDLPVRRLAMKVGRQVHPWHRNVVALGLAGGFIEPLESTAIHMIELALELLVRCFPLSGINPHARDHFNRRLNDYYDELRDFIALHYVATARRDTPFWRAATDEARQSPALRMMLGLWQDRHPAANDIATAPRLFGPASWQAILYGLEAQGVQAMANADRWVPDADHHPREVAAACERAVADLPSHQFWLQALATVEVPPPTW